MLKVHFFVRHIRRILSVIALFSLNIASADYAAAPYTDGDVFADTWVAADALGRTQPELSEAGPLKPEKQVGIF